MSDRTPNTRESAPDYRFDLAAPSTPWYAFITTAAAEPAAAVIRTDATTTLDWMTVSMNSGASPKETTGRSAVYVDLYLLEPALPDAAPELKLMARFRGRRAAQRAMARPDFVFDLTRNGGTIYMSTVAGSLPAVASALPAEGADDPRCWFRGYPRLSDGSALILWSLVWPRPDVVDELLDLIIRV